MLGVERGMALTRRTEDNETKTLKRNLEDMFGAESLGAYFSCRDAL